MDPFGLDPFVEPPGIAEPLGLADPFGLVVPFEWVDPFGLVDVFPELPFRLLLLFPAGLVSGTVVVFCPEDPLFMPGLVWGFDFFGVPCLGLGVVPLVVGFVPGLPLAPEFWAPAPGAG